MTPSFEELTSAYQNTTDHNDDLHRRLTEAAWADPLLARHRRHIEQHRLGFGDAAFHPMWAGLLEAAHRRFGAVRALEIGVFKGQVISLWSLLSRERRWPIRISAISPLAGQPLPPSRFWTRIRYRLDPRFRERVDNGDFYPAEDYAAIIEKLFADFGLDFGAVDLHRGYSTDPKLLAALAGETWHIIYVDGDHTLAGATHDFAMFGPKVVPGGWLVADDAGADLPGTAFWKGHASVSEATRLLPGLGFKNVLNVGHNRIFERIP